eukprot:Awhi_evm1s7006
MKPDWDKLMTEFKDSESILVGDVDCTAEGKALCGTVGVKGYPTIKHGDASDLKDYQGGRDFAALQKFARGLKPLCSPANINLCDAEQTAEIERIKAIDNDVLAEDIAAGDKKLADAETFFNDEVQKLQNAYQKLQADKEKTQQEINDSGLGLQKAVLAWKKKNPAADEKEEL